MSLQIDWMERVNDEHEYDVHEVTMEEKSVWINSLILVQLILRFSNMRSYVPSLNAFTKSTTCQHRFRNDWRCD